MIADQNRAEEKCLELNKIGVIKGKEKAAENNKKITTRRKEKFRLQCEQSAMIFVAVKPPIGFAFPFSQFSGKVGTTDFMIFEFYFFFCFSFFITFFFFFLL